MVTIFLFLCPDVYAEDTLLFFNDNIYSLKNSILNYDNDYFLNADEFARLTGLKYSIDERTQSISIEFNKTISNFLIKTSNSSIGTLPVKHVLPEIIDGELYFPLNFFEYFYNFVIKYNKDDKTLLILPSENIDNNILSTFVNLQSGYSIYIPDNVIINAGSTDYNYKGSTLNIATKNNIYSATITSDRLDSISINVMRSYFNDYISSDEEIFYKIVGYKQSYFKAMQEYYNREYLYSENIENMEVPLLKILADTNEDIYGKDSNIIVYNTIETVNNEKKELTYISIIIPSYENKTIYTIEFIVEKGKLNYDTINSINELIKSIVFKSLKVQKKNLEVLSDQKLISIVNRGIFPNLEIGNLTYTTLVNNRHGYSVTIPDYLLPYHMNSITNMYDYKSYRVNNNTILSISSEPSNFKPMEKLDFIYNYYMDIIFIKELSNKNISGKDVYYMIYELSYPNKTTYVYDYYIDNGYNLLNIKLKSWDSEPLPAVLREFDKIISSLKLTTAIDTDADSFAGNNNNLANILNAHTNNLASASNIESSYKSTLNEAGFDFVVNYPSDWELVQLQNTANIQYQIKNSDLTSSVNIIIAESEISSEPSLTNLINCLTGADPEMLPSYINNYSAPYIGSVLVPLNFSYYKKDGAVYVAKLIDYIDKTGRSNLCYSMDIIKDKKIYSLFISINEYVTKEGVIEINALRNAVNMISKSFSLKEINSDENDIDKNAAVKAIDSFMKNLYGNEASISDIVFSSSNEVFLTLNNVDESGYYKLRIEKDTLNISITGKLLKSEVMRNAISKIIDRYKKYNIISLKSNLTNMEIEIEVNINENVEKRFYSILGDISGNLPDIQIIRKPVSGNLFEQCESYIENYTGSNVITYLPDEVLPEGIYYNYIDNYSYIVMYADLGESSGYFIFDVNEAGNSILSSRYVSSLSIYNIIKDLYHPYTGYTLLDCYVDNTDKFHINVYLLQESTSLFVTEKYTVRFNTSTAKLELVKD